MAHADMTDSRRQTKVGRPTPGDALALQHVVEAIATGLDNQDDVESFLHAVPRSLWTPALTAFLDCSTAMPSTVSANWPHIELLSAALPPSVLTLLAATLPLRPCIKLECFADASPLASLVAVLGPALSCVHLCLSSGCTVRGGGQAISDLLLQRCPRLRHVAISVDSCSQNEAVELNDLLAVVAHPHVEELQIDLENTTAPPRLGHLLASWLSTAPATKLRLAHAAGRDHDAVIAFSDALQASTTLRELTMHNTPALGGFHGRTLPVSLKRFEWCISCPNCVVDETALTDLATAVGLTQLEHLECSFFGLLTTYAAAAPMLSQLQSLVVSGLNADHMPALIADLSSVPALTSLELRDCNLSSSTELMETLATTCVHLETLRVDDRDSRWVGGQLVAAGRHLHYLDLATIGRDSDDLEKRAICEALAQVHDVPFVLQTLPEGVDEFVVDALSPRTDRRHECALHF
ncbi:hypothetical protein SPRG_04319 [Saprolegnia parasitica CBS 223.65]|uniref:F-box domain-containing protein n=1 Tax=Saprolegnia parasitica (strain CBS 223.65) TaxID=695850 RepID=A0A067CME2_SAPPC|nr:hypothetical protein SPRG_04319 [Saprolegnia parasitica CBS 223.65]KDO30405.1 hypothetical protein SPRG_04319 [Saprolegnia parasitica CBS 223.65]|eukprot:XP_012198640.1 hypothetical protein SPRG_04319 [Saprolegnia parasitica CBS 223.65]